MNTELSFNELMKNDLDSWKKNMNKKGPFWLYYEEEIDHNRKKYTVIFEDKGKVKIGNLFDGMFCRYGIKTFGTLSKPSALGLWQSKSDAVSQKQLDAMISVYEENHTLTEFKIETLKNLVY